MVAKSLYVLCHSVLLNESENDSGSWWCSGHYTGWMIQRPGFESWLCSTNFFGGFIISYLLTYVKLDSSCSYSAFYKNFFALNFLIASALCQSKDHNIFSFSKNQHYIIVRSNIVLCDWLSCSNWKTQYEKACLKDDQELPKIVT